MSHRFFQRLLLSFFFIAASALSTGVNAQFSFKNDSAQSSTVVSTPRVRAELVAHAPQGVAPGQPLWLGLQLTHQPGWHTYWKNPGDSGLPTELTWTLPEGADVGDIAWPVPQKLRVEQMANYGYDGTVLLPVPLQLLPDFKAPLLAGAGEALTVRLHATWLACKLECIPEEGDFTLQLPLRGSTALHASAFDAALAAQPQPLSGDSSVRVDGEQLQIRIPGLPVAVHGQTLQLFSEAPAVIVHAAESGSGWTQAWQGDVWTATLPLSPERGASLAHLPLVLALTTPPQTTTAGADGARAWRTVATVEGAWSAAAPGAVVSPALAAALEANRALSAAPASAPANITRLRTLLMALLGGLLGGLILNLMPCVFPVLAIKVMGFAKHGSDRRAHRQAGLAYTAGVVLSFLALGGLLLALRAAGEQLGWGFQLQSPTVVAALAALFTLIGLNLAGVFEFGQFAPGRLAALQLRHPAADAFLTGVLAVAIASPCTAPFMGASLGFAIDMPATQALLVFAALGVGMALPYLAASWIPAVVGWLPRPGAWMDTFKRGMAFPMFATVAWLVWVLGQQSGIDGAGALLVLLVAGSAVVWALTLRGRTRWVLASILISASAWLLAVVGKNVTQMPETQALAAIDSIATATSNTWQPWSAERVAALNASGQPVFVDFTAAWCVTCQYNKRTTLANRAVLDDFAARKVALLRADWTRRDPHITEALSQLGRSGVPVYVLYAPGKPPVVMTEILTTDEVHGALSSL
ncbi:thioredoxin family protein [Simplicispira psychrophila]|uniref:thioredoxin family protein n=1 Tax=Simplicispira psychrophila TaxID=80882 RepID=UPI0004887932|nr:thioredoxin family protein [Simplicispira psychrophila]